MCLVDRGEVSVVSAERRGSGGAVYRSSLITSIPAHSATNRPAKKPGRARPRPAGVALI
jgi:hypothetical protein